MISWNRWDAFVLSSVLAASPDVRQELLKNIKELKIEVQKDKKRLLQKIEHAGTDGRVD